MKRNVIALGASLVVLGVGAGAAVLASAGTASPVQRAGPPGFVTTCLKLESGPARAACFVSAAGGHIPQFVRRCLAEADRGHCFRAHFLSVIIRRK